MSGLGPSLREYGMGSTAHNPNVAPKSASMTTLREEKEKELSEQDEKAVNDEKAYIPLDVARSKIAALTREMATMKQRHVDLMDQITDKYERLTSESRDQFQLILDETKARATLKLKENKAKMEELKEELLKAQDEHNKQQYKYRQEIKALTLAKAEHQQKLHVIDTEKKAVEDKLALVEAELMQRRGELETILQTHVDRTEFDKIEVQIADLTKQKSQLEEEKQQLETSLAEKTQQLSSTTHELEQAKQELQQAKVDLEQAKADLTKVPEGSVIITEAEKATLENAKERAELAESKVESLEQQVNLLQTAGAAGGNGPAQIITVPDPELQKRVRFLESEYNKLGQENEALQRQLVGAGGGSAVFASADMETVEQEVEVEEEIDDPDASASTETIITTTTTTSADPEVESKRQSLLARLAVLEPEHEQSTKEINELENELKPKKNDYVNRLKVFKEDSERKALEAKLNLATITEADGTTHELRPQDLAELETLLQQEATQAKEKPKVAAQINILKEKKKLLDENKTKLSNLKTAITEAKEANANAAPGSPELEAIKEKEQEFFTLKTQMQSDAAELKTSYSEYEKFVADFKKIEADLQVSLAKFKIDDTHAAEGKPRKLNPEVRTDLELLVQVVKNRSKERDSLKALADEVNTKNSNLKTIKAKKSTQEIEIAEIKQQLEALPAGTVVTSSSSSSSSTSATGAKPKIKRKVKKVVQVQRPKAGASASASSSTASSGQVKAFTPITPMTFKTAPSMAPAGAASAAGAGATGPGQDPELQKKYDELTKTLEEKEKLLDELQGNKSTQTAQIQSLQAEVQSLRAQLHTLQTATEDEKLRQLFAQLEEERLKLKTVENGHLQSQQALQQQHQSALSEAREKQQEINKLQGQLATLQSQLKRAEQRAATAGAAGGAVAAASAASGGGGGGGGGVDPSVVSNLEGQINTLQTQLDEKTGEFATLTSERDSLQTKSNEQQAEIAQLKTTIATLQADLNKFQTSLADELSKKEAELTTMYQDKINTLESTITDLNEKMKLIKTKAKQLHDNLKAETSTREARDQEIVTLKEEAKSLITTANEAKGAMDGLKAEVSKRDEIITTKTNNINELEHKKADLEKNIEWMEERMREEVRRRKEFQAKYEDVKGKVRVYARVRPFSKKEVEDQERTLLRPGKNEWTLEVNEQKKDVLGNVTDNWVPKEFDHVFQFGLDGTKGNGTQEEIFEETKIFGELAVQGINCCVFAYGQSGTGKTFTMAGKKPDESNGFTNKLLGLKPRMIELVYAMKETQRVTHDIDISCYMLEIYLNKLEDLFWKVETERKFKGQKKDKWPEPPELKVRVDAKKKVTVENVVIQQFETAKEMQDYCDEAETKRRVRRTGLNEESSRSHLVFALIVNTTDKASGKKTVGKCSLVDLAGSERADKTNVDGLSKNERAAMMEEGVSINESLRMLKDVFRILGSQQQKAKEAAKDGKKGKEEVVQYRGNMLTEMLQDCVFPSSLIATPKGVIRASDVKVGIELTGSTGEPVKVTEVHHGVTSIMFEFSYLLPTGATHKHLVTPNHLITLRWGIGPSVHIIKKTEEEAYHQVKVECYDETTLLPKSMTFRFLLPTDPVLSTETHSSAAAPVLPAMSEEEAIRFGWSWFDRMVKSGLVRPLFAGDILDVRAYQLLPKLRATTQRAREMIRIPLVSAVANRANAKVSNPVEHDLPLVAGGKEVSVTTYGDINEQLDAPVQSISSDATAAFIQSWCAQVDSVTVEEHADVIPSGPSEAQMHLALEQAAQLSQTHSQVCTQVNHAVRMGDNGQLYYSPVTKDDEIKTVYMLHNSSTDMSPQQKLVGDKSYTLKQLEKVWNLFKLDGSKLNVSLTELNPPAADATAEYDAICRDAMTAALSLQPRQLVVFGHAGRERWLSQWRQLENVAYGEVVADQMGEMLHLRLTSGAKIAVFFSTHPSAWAALEQVMITLSRVHYKQIEMTEIAMKSAIQQGVGLVGVPLIDIRQTEVAEKQYPYVAVTVAGDGRFVLADGTLTHNSLGGNAKTLMFVNVGPAASNITETQDSLRYGDLVKNITNEKASADNDFEEQIKFLSAKIRAYEAKFGAI